MDNYSTNRFDPSENNIAFEQESFQLAMQSMPSAMIVVDTHGCIILVNTQTEKLFGYPKTELIGQAIELLLPLRFRHKHIDFRKGFFQEQQARSMGAGRDLFGLHKDGTEIPLEIGLNPLHTGTQHVVVASIVDITERKRTEAKMIQMQKMESLGILAGGIAHDFNNLLTSILGYNDLGLRELPPNSPAREYINQAITGAHAAADLVKQLLAYSGKGWFHMQPIQVIDLIEEMGQLLQVSISKRCVLHYHFEENLPSIDADSAQLRQVIMNLIINASDAIGDTDGSITIRVGMKHCDHDYLKNIAHDNSLPEGHYVYVEISDTGCGMNMDTRARVFDPFFTTKSTGRGLGLAAVQGIVRRHGGAIMVYSDPGKGTRFKVLFPPGKQTVLKPISEKKIDRNWQGQGLALVIDDEEIVRTVAKIMLEKAGYTVIVAEDGKVGVELFEQFKKDIAFVLLDMTMPNMDGVETLRELKKMQQDVKVILSSGHGEMSTLAEFEGKGLAGFIQKPYHYNSLIQKIQDCLNE